MPQSMGGNGAGAVGQSEVARMSELIMRIFLHFRQRLRKLTNDEPSLSVTEMLVLWTISTAGAMKFHRLSRQVGIPVSTLTTMVDRLESRGYLRRRPDPEDRRAIYVEGTPVLATIRERHASLMRSEIASVVARLRPDQVRETLAGLQALAWALTGVGDEDRPDQRDQPGAQDAGPNDRADDAGGDER